MGCIANSAAKVIVDKSLCNGSKLQFPSSENNAEVFVYPDPFTSGFTIHFSNNKNPAIFDFEIINTEMERVMAVKNLNFSAGEEQKINASKLTPGIYFYRLINNDCVYTGKVIKQ